LKVTKTTTTGSETSSTIELFDDVKVPAKLKTQIKEAVGEYLVEQTLLSVGNSNSPLEGYGKFPGLSDKYKKKKKSERGDTSANLNAEGDMLDSLDFKTTREGVTIGVYGKNAPKADGHNNLSGESKLPLRRFLPDTSDAYAAKIEKGIKQIIADTIAENLTPSEEIFAEVESRKELFEALRGFFGGNLTNAEISLAVFRNAEILKILEDLELDEFL
jgi:hypothetical protein